jgi:thioredoxin-like negative regulator of GroEL
VHFNPLGGFKDGQIAAILHEASKKRGSLVVGIVHCHVPGNPESEQLADSLNGLAKKYGSQVQVIRVDIVAFPAFAKVENVTKPPKVVMIVGTARVFEFQGLWPRPQIERKVDEILHGLERVGKDWRPEVKGMQRASGATPPSLPKPSQP